MKLTNPFKKRLWRDVIRVFLLFCLFPVLRLYFALIRVRPNNDDALLSHLASGGKVVVVLWHQRLLYLLALTKLLSPLSPAAIISASRDGDVFAAFCAKLGARPLRGSSSYRGKEAMNSIVADFEENNLAIHILDGPTGPPGKAKAGIVRIAQKSGAAIFPLFLSARRAWQVGSWDRMLIPKPFAAVTSLWGTPLYLPQDLTSTEFEEQRQIIEKNLLAGQLDLDVKCQSSFRLLRD